MTPQDVLNRLNETLIKFGTDLFDDKGPSELMYYRDISEYIMSLSKEGAATFLKEIVDAEGYSDRNKDLAHSIFGECDEVSDDWIKYVEANSGAEY